MPGDFDWNDTDSVIVKQVDALAVYKNPAGDIVIRQRAGMLGEEDSFVVVPFERAREVIEAIKREITD